VHDAGWQMNVKNEMAERLHLPVPLERDREPFDVVIVGGGPAGLSAALVLGRCRRRVLVCDSGTPRNARASALHGFLTRDGTPPLELLRLGRDELLAYGIEPRNTVVTDVIRVSSDQFEVVLEGGERLATRSVLLATGVQDELPQIPGLADCYGISVHHCPYCDGWEVRDRTVGALGEKVSPAGLALSLKTWTGRVIAFTNGRARVGGTQKRRLDLHGITLHQSRISRIEHDNGRMTHVVLQGGQAIACDALFFTAPQRQQCELARQLGCEFTKRGTVKTDHLGNTCVPGIYVVGDASRDVQFVVVAAAEGAKAGVAINQALQRRDGLVADTPVAVGEVREHAAS
jgi:thioredoxin reductase